MDKRKLDKWANQLLDTGKRNNLINYKDVKTSTVEVVLPSSEVLFEKVDSAASFEVYDPKLAEDFDEAEGLSENSSEEAKLNREEYISTYSSKLKKKDQILLYNAFITPIKALKNIDKKAREHAEETGVNVAYLAFGFIHWKENENATDVYRAPILLAPISIRNDSAISPWYIQMTEEDVIVNPTFSYKLANEFGVSLPEIGEESFEEYLTKVENVVSKLGWSVSGECKVGIFSFLKLNMYQDLIEHADKILQNNNVRMLLGESYDAQGISLEEGEYHLENPLIELHSVVDADSSQVDAIEMAKAGMSFVLQGPPGTGKSQTITNIIAESIYDGKKILFVSEKQAALNVVYDKLKKAGLDEFCLELHSHKANKKAFIDEVVKTLKSPKKKVDDAVELEIEEKLRNQKNLDMYERELHQKRGGINKSLFQLYKAYAAYRKTSDFKFTIECIGQKGEDYLKEARNLLAQYVDFTASIGYQYKNNPWYGYINPDTSYQIREELRGVLGQSIALLTEYEKCSELLNAEYALDYTSLNQTERWRTLFSLLAASEVLTPSFMNRQACERLLALITKMEYLATAIVEQREWINPQYDKEIYGIDYSDIYKKLTRQHTNSFSRLFNAEYKKIISDIRINRISGKKPSYAEAVDLTGRLCGYAQNLEEFNALEQEVRSSLGAAYVGVDSDWKAIEAEIKLLLLLFENQSGFETLERMQMDSYAQNRTRFLGIANQLAALQSKTEVLALLKQSFDKQIFDIENIEFDKAVQKLQLCADDFEKLDNWCRFYSLWNELGKKDLLSFVDATIEENVNPKELIDTYQRNFYRQWIDYVLHSSPVLATFNRVEHDRYVQRFTQEDTNQFFINKMRIKEAASSKRPSLEMVAGGSAISVLLREGEKKRKLKSIRGLLEEAGELIQRIKPCFLMSPLSVSTYLNPETTDFDLVIFDEASQIFPQDAIGAIYRGQQVIVVGDSKQMPPTNFFNASAEDNDSDEEMGDVTDFESILDLCSATLPQKRLGWHYRSKYEQLIAFSNMNFYDNGLITFPSAKSDQPWRGVDFHYCDGGVFDHKSKNNRVEAEAVVELIFENLEKHPERSLGVVAFSMSQQNLIENLLLKRRIMDPSKELFFNKENAEPFFVKNLETVQGDERDTIIFSVGYAKDAAGKLIHNFGPLNRIGGERRLNVAITRAKYNVQLVASIHHTDIDLSRTNSQGTHLLKAYLDYAENGSIALERSVSVGTDDQFDSEFEMEVCDFLREKGYTVDTQVGCSGFRIDLGVKRPDTSDYVLAIECDGATYHSSRNARDRDRLRQEILESMGWKFYRIWSTEWFKNGVIERERLVASLDAALCAASKERDVEPAHKPVEDGTYLQVYEKEIVDEEFSFPKYEIANVYTLCQQYANFQDFVRKVLEVEAPLSEEWFLKRIAGLFGREKVTSVVQREYEARMVACDRNGIIRREGFLYLQGMNNYQLRVPQDDESRRDIGCIAKEELAAGLLEVIRYNISIEKDSLFRFVVQKLGFQRTTEAMIHKLDAALDLLDSCVTVDNGSISMR